MSIITCRSHASRGAPRNEAKVARESLFQYIGGATGSWRITDVTTLSGSPLKPATHVEITTSESYRLPGRTAWVLRGVARNTRFFTREERFPAASSRFLSNSMEASCAALIPIRKSAEWWNLAAEDRQEMIAHRSRKLTRAMAMIPALARRFLFGRDLGEPFDVVTWFEYAPKDAPVFDDLAAALRASPEWQYVEREIDIRLVRELGS